MKNPCFISAALFLSAVLSTTLFSQPIPVIEQVSKIPDDARYIFVQSRLSAKGSFRFDRWTGGTWQIVETEDKKIRWHPVLFEAHPKDGPLKNEINFHIFLSGLGLMHTYVINLRTGGTWQMRQGSDGLYWAAITEPNPFDKFDAGAK